MYNPAFDPFNGIYRMLHILKHFDTHDMVEVDRLRIYDFYLLFPYKAYKIRLKSTETDYKKRLARFVKEKKENPYNKTISDRRLFLQLKPYQMIALSHIASYGLIDPQLLMQQKVKVADVAKMQQVMSQLEEMSDKENNIISWLNSCFRTTPLSGTYGLKYRTQLLEYKYDGC